MKTVSNNKGRITQCEICSSPIIQLRNDRFQRFCSRRCLGKYAGKIPKGLPIKQRFMTHVKKEDRDNGCWLWTGGLFHKGYGIFNEGGRSGSAHRYAWRLFRGEIPKSMCICHTCDVRNCVNPDHLWIGTAKENTRDMYHKKRQRQIIRYGENNPSSKLTVKDVLEIREMYASGDLICEIAERFNKVSKTIVGDVARGKRWAWVKSTQKTQADTCKEL